ncbi:hypothetical protein NE237_017549 [Protea cynaroides]|uniref:HMA domain-containing protein n=1 Tax=Protea cynaroides TaxID=273540 RepID=A0A9Q0QN41_9MAGN|nr:hypothetical protein NE237_017549 [Protea cynaroides]
MSKKTVVSVELLCSKCKKKVMKLIAGIEGINSIALDPSKSTVSVTGDADPFEIIRQVRKFRKSAKFVSVGPPKDEKNEKNEKNEKKEKKEKKDISPCVSIPNTCQKCNVWYVVREDDYNYCSIL